MVLPDQLARLFRGAGLRSLFADECIVLKVALFVPLSLLVQLSLAMLAALLPLSLVVATINPVPVCVFTKHTSRHNHYEHR